MCKKKKASGLIFGKGETTAPPKVLNCTELMYRLNPVFLNTIYCGKKKTFDEQ